MAGAFEIDGIMTELPGHCDALYADSDVLRTEDAFAWYFWVDGRWEQHLKPWVQRINDQNELRADVIAFLSEAGTEGLILAERIRKVGW